LIYKLGDLPKNQIICFFIFCSSLVTLLELCRSILALAEKTNKIKIKINNKRFASKNIDDVSINRMEN